MSQQMNERADSLEQDLARLMADQEIEKREFERKIQGERLNCESLRDSFAKLQNDHSSNYRAALEGPAQQVSALEGAISEIQRSSDVELGGLRSKSEKLRLRVEELEGELGRVQTKLASTEQEVQEGTARVNLAKANHRAAKETLDREKQLKSEEVNQVQRCIVQKTEQLKAITRSGEDQRRRMLREIDDAKSVKAKQLADADSRLQALRTEYSVAIEDKDLAVRADVTTDRIEGLSRENDHLRRYVHEHQHAATHIQDVGSQMQRTLASMEDRAADLRRELRH